MEANLRHACAVKVRDKVLVSKNFYCNLVTVKGKFCYCFAKSVIKHACTGWVLGLKTLVL